MKKPVVSCSVIMIFVSVVVLVMLTLGCQAQLDLGTCNLQCDGDGNGLPKASPNQLPNRIQGPPGKRGVTGLKGFKGDQGLIGPKGDPAEKCNCHEVKDLKRAMFPQTCSDFLVNDENESGIYTIYPYGDGAILPQSCSDILSNDRVKKSGVYTIYPYGDGDLTHLRVFCDMETDGGGWMVFQKRIDGLVDFYRNFADYVKGFGRLEGEFWLGLDVLHKLTKDGEYEMRIDMEDFENQTRYASYNDFIVGGGTNYTLTFTGYSGNAGSGLQAARFSAKDRDQDTWPGSCSNTFKGAWWYTSCHAANPNGLYLGGPHESDADGINWSPWRGYHYSLKRIEMKLKKN